MGRSRIDDARLTDLWAEGLSSNEIAEFFGVQYPAVNSAARRLGLPSRRHGGSKPRALPPAPVQPVEAPRPEPRPSTLRIRVGETGGRYSDLNAFAAQEGITFRRALQEWHKHRSGHTQATDEVGA